MGCRQLGQTYGWSRSESLSLFLDEFVAEVEAAMRDRYNEMIGTIITIQAGVSRGLASSLGKKPPKIPEWEEFLESNADPEIWWEKGK